MAPPDPDFIARIAGAFAQSDGAATNDQRGAILEDLTQYVLEKIPGVKHWRTRFINGAGSAEFDVCFVNDERSSPVYKFGHVIIVECKNTKSKSSSATVRILSSKLQEVKASWGILLAANGITGSGKRVSRAHDVIREARANGVNILVVTRADLLALTNPADVERMLIDKIMSHTLRAPQF